MKTIREQVGEGRILISDGAWGTFLMAKGLQSGECPEWWNLERRADVLDVALSYVAAGSDMITTNSFGGSRIKLAASGLTDKTAEINRCAAAISREAAGPDRHVIASIGPTGKFLMTGEVTEQELYETFAEQASALEAGGADACCIETMMAPDEAAIAARAARENTRLEVLCTFTFDHPVNGVHRTMMGSSPQEVAAAALEAGAHIVGSNCGYGPAEMVEVVRALRAAAPGVPILVQPNAGLPETGPDGLHYPETPESMAGYVGRLLEAGANILGGCCGTTPAHIRLIKAAADRAVS